MMQLLIVALLAGQPATPAKALDLCVATHRAMTSASVVVETENRIAGMATNSARFELAYQQPSRLKMRVKQPKLGGQPASDRTYTLTPGQFAGLDTINNEYVLRPMPKEGTLAELSGTVMGSLDDAVQTILEPKVLEAFVGRVSPLKGWTMKRSGDLLKLEQRTGPNAVQFDLDRSAFRMRRMRLETSQGHIEWRFAYGSRPATIAFKPPRGANEVVAFYVGGSATYADAKAKTLAQSAIKAYEGYRTGAFDVEVGGARTRVQFDRRKARQKGQGADWAFDGKVATLRDPATGRVYRGAATFSELLTALSASKQAVDPTLRLLMVGRNPVRELLGPGMKARRVGSIAQNGKMCEILELEGPGARISLWLDASTHLMVRIATENRDGKGNTVSESEKTFTYLAPSTVTAQSFSLGAGEPLSKLMGR